MATVEAIVEAGARVLAQRGPTGFSTNHVAAAAGVSIGSLYQYFPGKEALMEAIRRRHLEEVLAVIRLAYQAGPMAARRIEVLIDGLIAVHSRLPDLHRVLLELAPPHGGSAADAGGFRARYLDAYEMLVDSVGRPCKPARRRLIASVLAGAVEGAIHAGARAGTAATPGFRKELIRLTLGFLTQSRSPS